MKKLFAKVTAAISAAAMLAVPAINVNAADNQPKKDYLDSNNRYHRVVWEDNKGLIKGTGYKDVLVGDVNKTSTITEADATAILQYLGNPNRYPVDPYAADVDGNGDIDRRDAELILYFVSHEINHVAGYQQYYNDWIWESTNNTYRVFSNNDKTYSTVLIGDVNNDKKINIADVVLANRAKNEGFFIFGDDYIRAGRAADINNDGRVNDTDTDFIYDVIVGRRSNFDDIA